VAIFLLLGSLSTPLLAEQNPTASAAQSQTPSSTPATSTLPSHSSAPITEYRLPSDLHEKAHSRNRIHFRLDLIGIAYGIVVLLMILRWRVAPKYRDWSERFSARNFLQSAVFVPLLLLTIAILTSPLDIYGEAVEKQYGISVQTWGSWGWDWIKGQLISCVLGTILIWLLYLVIRRSPRRWWLYFWLISLPIGAFLVFLQPLVIDPMFHKFEPLQQKDPALVASLEQMVRSAGQNIPPERMFWMGAGEKTTSLNAYVTGLGASKRIVVWDNTIKRVPQEEILMIYGHEQGHYVLHHIVKGLVFFGILMLVFFWIAYKLMNFLLVRYGTTWHIPSAHDWSSLGLVLLLMTALSFFSEPIGNSFSRWIEHQADIYGIEVTHGIVPDTQKTGGTMATRLGEMWLAYPDPNNFVVFWRDEHQPPPARRRPRGAPRAAPADAAPRAACRGRAGPCSGGRRGSGARGSARARRGSAR